jgi:UDP-glucose 4-epimerase
VARKVLVTGGAGFIGSNLTRALVQSGHSVVVLDDLSAGSVDNLRGLEVKFLEGDVRDPEKVGDAVNGCNWVFHLAAVVSVTHSLEDPMGCYRTNLEGSLQILEAARLQAVEKVILSSSCAVYGDREGPVSEEMAAQPMSPYASSKLAMESAAAVYSRSYNVSTLCLRYFNVYGPGQSTSSDYAAVIPVFLEGLLAGESITVDGNGMQKRDFVYVDDVVRANLLAAEADLGPDVVINIGSGSSASVLDLVGLLQRIFPNAAEPGFGPPRRGDIQNSAADLSKAERTLGYRPAIVLQTGLDATVEWFRSKERNRT